ncbi:MAG: phosphocarrier protein HPr [Chlamydiales bacterium]|jgi:phosphocarrier protein HPr
MNRIINKQLKKVRDFFTVCNDKGLHTRPSTELVKCAAKYRSQINLIHKKATIDAKSLLGILALAATKGTKIHIEAFGDDAENAIQAILDLAANKFNVKY